MTGPPPTADVEALFVPDGDLLVPTELARGPWSPDALHGGPVAAVVARSVAATAGTDDGMQLVRLTLDLLRPVGTDPLAVTSTVVRGGRRVQVVDTVVVQGGVEVAWARGLRLRTDPTLPPVAAVEDPTSPAGPAEGVLLSSAGAPYRAFHTAGVEARFVAGRFTHPGPATAWIRLQVPVVAGEEPAPDQRAVAASDFGNGISAELDFRKDLFVNPDLTVSLDRLPEGEWVCLDARTRFGAPGIGLAESSLWDVRGRIGRAVQLLVVEPGR